MTLTVAVTQGGHTIKTRVVGRTVLTRDADGPSPLYVSRTLEPACGSALAAWARQVGLKTVTAPTAMHVTIAYSKNPVDWFKLPIGYSDTVLVRAGGPRRLEIFGGEGKPKITVLRFASSTLHHRWEELKEAGCSWDWPEYAPHITLAADSVGVTKLKAYSGELVFGPEVWAPL